jgi:hypothetical protein
MEPDPKGKERKQAGNLAIAKKFLLKNCCRSWEKEWENGGNREVATVVANG